MSSIILPIILPLCIAMILLVSYGVNLKRPTSMTTCKCLEKPNILTIIKFDISIQS